MTQICESDLCPHDTSPVSYCEKLYYDDKLTEYEVIDMWDF